MAASPLLPWIPKKTLAIFAHPDDEAFGPGGTLAALSKAGSMINLICVTDGDSQDGPKNLGEIRAKELQASAKILGINHLDFLHYQDGTLNNNLYHTVAQKIIQNIEAFQPELLLTFEMQGVSGHIDHTAVAFYTTYAFRHTQTPQELWYFCISVKQRLAEGDDYFIYFPPGYEAARIDLALNVEKVWDTKVKAMYCHQSQINDVNRILKKYKSLPKREHFLIQKR